ncbi:MAG: hypothetical protein ACLPX8_07030 [Bryobacteraceae bacterium]
MSSLADQLYGIYVARIFPVLAQNDPVYQQSLNKAGLGWRAPEIVPPVHLASFQQEMKLQAWLGATRIENARSLDPATIRAKLLTGPLTLYRVSQSGPASPPGIWWFTEKVAQRCRDEAGPDPQKRLDWLRSVLAVCFNWSRFDRIERLALHSGESIPAVLGRGLPMPHYKADPYIDRKTGERLIALPADYWKKKGEMLLGGESQIVLPWVPVRRVAATGSV